MRLYVITGGPGVGKTTLINELTQGGYQTVQEDARALIRAEVQQHGDALPWARKDKYAIRMLERGIKCYEAARLRPTKDPVFFDRSVVDALAYAAMENIGLPSALITSAELCRYEKSVFILPPWEDIYEKDAERKQNWSEALRTFECLKNTYRALGYELIEVPIGSVEDRCAFVLENSHCQKRFTEPPA